MSTTEPQVVLPETRTVKIGDLTPYFRNPRTISPEAIAAVRESIERYGYQQPIVVDAENVIVVGHTRFYAMKEMGVTDVQVYVTRLPEDKVREYRVIDNRTGEMSVWDHSALVMELREFDEALLTKFFPDVDLEVSALTDAMVSADDIEKATKKVLSVKEAPNVLTTTVECPACFHTFDVRTDSLPGLSHRDLAEMQDGEKV
jgi:hypothetical protein